MRHQYGFIQIPLLIAIIAGVLVLSIGGYFGVTQYQKYRSEKEAEQAELRKLADEQKKALEEAQTQIQSLKKESEAAKQKQSALERKVQETKQEQEKEEQPLPPKETKLSKAEIIKSWQNSVLKISCLMTDTYTQDSFIQSGSGSGFKLSDGRIFFFTNKHVLINEEGYGIEKCVVSAPNLGNFEISLASVRLHNKFDFSDMVSDESGKNFAMSYNLDFCPADIAQLGDEVLILGYPITGSQSSITVTDGIISGFEENYFVTSAKIEQGNSGGAAILVKKNCFLGLPTAAAVGSIESLGRILKIEKIINYGALNR